MIRAYRSEWLKIRQPAMILGGAGSMIGFAILAIVFTLRQLGSGGRDGRNLTATLVSANDGFAGLIANSTTFIGIVALAVFAIAIGMEYSNGTLRNLLVRQPKRLHLLAGKVLALASFVTVAALLADGAALATATILAPHYGASTSAWFAGDGLWSLLTVAINLVLSTLAWGAFGAVLGVALRSTASAVVIGLIYALPVENLLTAAWSGGKHWLPGQLFNVIAQGGTSAVTYTSAATIVGIYLVIAVAFTAMLFQRRDVAN